MEKFDVGKALRLLRKRHGLSQGDIFKKTGIKESYLSRIENGKVKHPRITIILSIASAIGVTCNDVIETAFENGFIVMNDGDCSVKTRSVKQEGQYEQGTD